MILLSITLSDPWPGFQSRSRSKMTYPRTMQETAIVTIER